MASVIPFRRIVGPAARRVAAPALRSALARLADAIRHGITRRDLCLQDERQLRDIGLSRGAVERPADVRLAVLSGSDRRGTSLLYVPGF